MNGKWIYLGQRNARRTREEFLARWLHHRTLGAPPAMGAEFVTADYAAVRAEAGIEGVSDEYDAVGLFSLRGLSSIPTVAKFLKLDHIQADERRFFTTISENFSMFAAEKVCVDAEPGGHVLVQFLRRAADVSPYDFEQRWADQAKAVQATPGLGRYVQNVVIAPQPPGFGYDGVGELWFSDAQAMKAAVATIDQAMKSWSDLDYRNSFCLLTDIIAARPRKT